MDAPPPAQPPAQAPDAASPAARPAPTNADFFWTLLKIGLTGFGGVLPFARRALVEKKGWLTEAEFAELLSLGQSLPGPNIVNVVVMLGYRHHGIFGALNCVCAILLAPMAIVLSLASVYAEYAEVPWVQRMMAGIASAAAGLILTMGVSMVRAQPRRAALYLLTAGTIVAKLAGAPLLLVLFVFAGTGMFLSARGAF
jgi:chromate transporter